MKRELIKTCINKLLDEHGFNSEDPRMSGQQEEALCQVLKLI